jgi:hypothetical protein
MNEFTPQPAPGQTPPAPGDTYVEQLIARMHQQEAEVAAQRAEEGEPWYPENVGDSIGGLVVGYGRTETRFGIADTILLQPPGGGPRRSVILSAVLRSHFEDTPPTIGQTVALLTFLGTKESQASGVTYKDFSVRSIDPEPQPDRDVPTSGV